MLDRRSPEWLKVKDELVKFGRIYSPGEDDREPVFAAVDWLTATISARGNEADMFSDLLLEKSREVARLKSDLAELREDIEIGRAKEHRLDQMLSSVAGDGDDEIVVTARYDGMFNRWMIHSISRVAELDPKPKAKPATKI